MSYLNDLRAHAKSIRKMHGSERSPMQRAVFVLDGEICRDEATIKELESDVLHWKGMTKGRESEIDKHLATISRQSCENEALKKVADAARGVMDAENDKSEAMNRLFAIWNDWFERVSEEQKSPLTKCPKCGDQSLAPGGWCVSEHCDSEGLAPFLCSDCHLGFESQKKLDKHLRYSCPHQTIAG